MGRIGRPLLQLPIRFCANTLQHEVNSLPANAWTEHPQKFNGNIAVPLVSPYGAITNAAAGPMAATEWLSRCPYILQIMEDLGCTWGRSRLMGLRAGATVPEHVDIHYYWRTHLRLHIPVVTNPGVAFGCAGDTLHLAAGECWLLDSFYRHSVRNSGPDRRIHLVLDTVGGGRLWDLIASAIETPQSEDFVAPRGACDGLVRFEQINSPTIMSAWEIKSHAAYLSGWTDAQPHRDCLMRCLDRFVMNWEASWAQFGETEKGLPDYVDHLRRLRKDLAASYGSMVRMRNDIPLAVGIEGLILNNAVAPSLLQKARCLGTTT